MVYYYDLFGTATASLVWGDIFAPMVEVFDLFGGGVAGGWWRCGGWLGAPSYSAFHSCNKIYLDM